MSSVADHGDMTSALVNVLRVRGLEESDPAFALLDTLVTECDRLREALREVYAVTVHVEDAVEAATRASHIAQEALDA